MTAQDPLELRALSDVLHASGETYRRDGDFARAAEFLRKSLEVRETLGDAGPIAQALSDLGRVLVLLGEVDEARDLVGRAAEAHEALGDAAGLATCHDALGDVAREQGRPEDAEGHYAKALALKRETGDEKGMAATLALYGLLHSERGDWNAAGERYRAALAIFERVGDREQVASVTNNLGTLALRRGDLNDAADELESARTLFDELDDRRGVGKCLNNLGGIYRALGKDGKSIEAFRSALELFEDIGFKRGAAMAANNLAVIEQDFGRYDEASALHRRSLELKREMGDRPGEAVSLGNLGDVAYHRGEWEKAGDLYREALAIQEETGNRAGLAWLHNHAARLALAQGRSERAAKEAAAARRLGREVGSREVQAEALVTEIALALGAGDAAGARSLLEEVEEHARNMRSREIEAAVRRARGEVLAASDRPEDAEEAFDEAGRAFKRLRRAFDRAGVDLARGIGWARGGRGDRAVEPMARAEEILEGIGAGAHALIGRRTAVEILAKTKPGEGRELAEAGQRLAHRLGDDEAADRFRESLEDIVRGEDGEDVSARRLREVGRLAERLLRTPAADEDEELERKLLALVVEEVRGDRALLLVRRRPEAPFRPITTPGLGDPSRTDAIHAAERVAETGEILRDFRGGDRTSPRSRLVVPFGMSEGGAATGVFHLEASVGARGFEEADGRFVAAAGSVFALFLRRRPRADGEARRAAVAARAAGEGPGEGFGGVVGESKRMAEVFETARKVAGGTATVLVLGESGTGKELLARAVHRLSPRRDDAFVAVNCPSIPRDLLESELFGHEKGAFTGADEAKAGRLELADGGTLFLDEIGDLPFSAQAKLLRVLQERAFERLGGLETLRIDVRILAATSVDLAEAVAERRFREDLYYRLNVVPIVMPALRERPEDIPGLVDHFLEKYFVPERPVEFVSPEAMRLLRRYPWPGNVRELENAIQYAVNLMEGDTLRPGDLPRAVRSAGPGGPEGRGSLDSELDRLERDLILAALEETDWNRSEAARRLGTNESKIRARMRKHGIRPPRPRVRPGRRNSRRRGGFVDSDES